MKYVPGLMVGQMSGSAGNTTASHGLGGSYIRTRVVPVNPSSAAQTAVRATFSACSASWADLTDAVRLQWNVWAANNPITDSLGQQVYITGLAWFVRVQCALVAGGMAQLAGPPPDQTVTQLGVTDLAIEATLIFTQENALSGTEKFQVWASAPVSAGIVSPKSVKLCLITTIAQATDASETHNWTAPYVARFGTVASFSGRRVFAEVRAIRPNNAASVVCATVSQVAP